MPPLDVDATVIANRRLSRDYNVLTLSAAEVGARTGPGQFVMVKPACTETLLRRPFSVFEVLRHPDGAPSAISILNKRAGRTTNALYEAEPGDRVRTRIVSPDQGVDFEVAITDPHAAVTRVRVSYVVRSASGEREEVEFTLEDELPGPRIG